MMSAFGAALRDVVTLELTVITVMVGALSLMWAAPYYRSQNLERERRTTRLLAWTLTAAAPVLYVLGRIWSP